MQVAINKQARSLLVMVMGMGMGMCGWYRHTANYICREQEGGRSQGRHVAGWQAGRQDNTTDTEGVVHITWPHFTRAQCCPWR